MIPVKHKTAFDFARILGALLLIFAPLLAAAQVGPAMRRPPSLHVFGTGTYGISDGDSSTGLTLGGYVQTSHAWGVELRGDYLHWANNRFRYDAMLGPRIARHFGRLSPYGAAMGGAGHVVKRKGGPKSAFESNSGAEIKLLGGVDYYATHHLSIRLGEISFSEYYAFPKGVSAIDVSSGLVFHIPVRER